jgi:long-chain fatty acid transport protein
MKFMKSICHLAMLTAIAAPVTSAMATDGYFSHGAGMKAKGMGGASVTSTDNTFAGANNPATAAFAGNRLEGGVDIFMPDRGMSRTGAGPLDADVTSGSKTFFIPEMGFNKTINDSISAGITVYGNGGMNTDYAGGQINCGRGSANVLCGADGLGVDLMQLVVAPTLAYKINPNHSVGISPLLVYQQFKAKGLQGFTQMSGAPENVTNTGTDSSSGFGVRLGYFGKINESISVGASYAPKIKMSKFDKYAGLFANAGSFDIPENYTVGVGFQATPSVSVALDYQRINYSGVTSIGNPSTNRVPLGFAGGPGFGWSDINVFKLGVQWQAMPALTLRAGLNIADNPIQSRDVSFNIVAPGVTTSHITLGGTYAFSPTTELTVAYMHAPKKSVTGPSFLAGTETIRMSQNSLGFQVGMKF